ncbi:MAG: hypothetical protein ACI4L7_01570 [Christensenellales bacterium]
MSVYLWENGEKKEKFFKKVVDSKFSLWYSCLVVTAEVTNVLRHDNSTITTAYLFCMRRQISS